MYDEGEADSTSIPCRKCDHMNARIPLVKMANIYTLIMGAGQESSMEESHCHYHKTSFCGLQLRYSKTLLLHTCTDPTKQYVFIFSVIFIILPTLHYNLSSPNVFASSISKSTSLPIWNRLKHGLYPAHRNWLNKSKPPVSDDVCGQAMEKTELARGQQGFGWDLKSLTANPAL